MGDLPQGEGCHRHGGAVFWEGGSSSLDFARDEMCSNYFQDTLPTTPMYMHQKIPYKLFLKTFKHVPRVAINLLIRNKNGQVLLTKRGIAPFRNYWHLPGSFLLKNESLKQCLLRVAKQELGIVINHKKTKLLDVFDDIYGDPRGHVVDIVYGVNLNQNINLKRLNETKELGWFKKSPKKIGFNHRETLKKLGH